MPLTITRRPDEPTVITVPPSRLPTKITIGVTRRVRLEIDAPKTVVIERRYTLADSIRAQEAAIKR